MKMPLSLLWRGLLCFACLIALAPIPANAQLTFTLTPKQTNLLPGSTSPINLIATLTNVGSETVSLLGTSSTINGANPASLTVDVTSFEDNLPFTLAPLASYTNTMQAFFTPNALVGDYSFNYGVDGQGNSFYHAEDTANFHIGAAVTTSAPEPVSIAFAFAGGIPLLLGLTRRRNAQG